MHGLVCSTSPDLQQISSFIMRDRDREIEREKEREPWSELAEHASDAACATNLVIFIV